MRLSGPGIRAVRGLVFAPRLTRLVWTAASAIAVADFLHLASDVAKRAAAR